jgi:hypothetical protein
LHASRHRRRSALQSPAPLAAITMKLLAKNAEDRYQTAVGDRDATACRAFRG